MRPQRVRIIGSSSGWVTLKKPLSETSDHAGPLLRPHPRHHRVIMDARIVDEDLDRAGGQNSLHGSGRLVGPREVETQSFRAATMRDDFVSETLRALQLPVGMQIDVMSGRREIGRDGGADAAARAGNECALHAGASNRTVARPLSHSSSPAITVNT